MMYYATTLCGGRYYVSPWARLCKGGDAPEDFADSNRMTLALAVAAGGMMWVGDATNWTAGKTPAQYEAIYPRWRRRGSPTMTGG